MYNKILIDRSMIIRGLYVYYNIWTKIIGNDTIDIQIQLVKIETRQEFYRFIELCLDKEIPCFIDQPLKDQ
jgi:integrase